MGAVSRRDFLRALLRRRRYRRQAVRQRKDNRRRAAALTALFIFSLAAAGLLLAAGSFWQEVWLDLPRPEQVASLLNPPEGVFLHPTQVYGQKRADETVQPDVWLASLAPQAGPRPYLPLYGVPGTHIPEALAQATILLDDPGFWSHGGYMLAGLNQPDWHPTLAQKLVFELLLQDEPSDVVRAVRERILAAELTARYGRAQVLEWYLNIKNYGRYARGVEAAAQLYFGKSAAQLNLAEAAVLAAVGQTPALNPFDAPEAARAGGRSVLTRMYQAGLLDGDTYQAASQAPVRFAPAQPPPDAPPALQTAVRQLAGEISPERISLGGLNIGLSLDTTLQSQVDCLLQAHQDGVDCGLTLPPDFRLPDDWQAQVVVLNPQNGRILAMAVTPGDAWQGLLPAGDMLTPFIYLTAFTRGFSPANLVWDIPDASLPDRDGIYHGPIRLREALANGDEVPAATVQAQVGAENVRHIAALHGLNLPYGSDFVRADTLVSPLDLAQAYGVWAAGGILSGQEIDGRLTNTLSLIVGRQDCSVWLDWQHPQIQAVLTPQLAYLMTDVLADETVRRSTAASRLDLGMPLAVKMGHAPDGIWIIGYTPSRLTALWISSSQPVDESAAADLWSAIMRAALQGQPAETWSEPAGLSHVTVCNPSGLLPTDDCPETVREIFLSGNEPTQYDTLYQRYRINRETGRLATVFTPPDLVEERLYLNVPPEARDWAQANGWNPPPDTYDTVRPPRREADAVITSPDLFQMVSGEVPISGTAAGQNFAWYRVQAGAGVDPEAWMQVGEQGTVPVTNGRLALWNTRTLDDGLYALQLLVVDQDGNLKTALTQVTVDNTPPEILSISPEDGSQLPHQEAVALEATVRDNLALARVKFYLDGRLVGDLQSAPWAVLVDDVSAGSHVLRVTVLDAAGNQAFETVNFWVSESQ